MIWIIIVIVVVVAILVYRASNNYNQAAVKIVAQSGGMLKKYDELLQFLESTGAPLQKVTKDSVVLKSSMAAWWVDCIGPNVEIYYRANVPTIGRLDKQWTFAHDYSQQLIISEIQHYCDWQAEQLARAIE